MKVWFIIVLLLCLSLAEDNKDRGLVVWADDSGDYDDDKDGDDYEDDKDDDDYEYDKDGEDNEYDKDGDDYEYDKDGDYDEDKDGDFLDELGREVILANQLLKLGPVFTIFLFALSEWSF